MNRSLTLYKRRWKVDEYHKSLKSSCSLGKCQASSHASQPSHFYLCVIEYLLLEKVRLNKDKNHFALMKELNILTVKYGLKAMKNNCTKPAKTLKWLRMFSE